MISRRAVRKESIVRRFCIVSIRKLALDRPRLVHAALWFVAVVLTLATFAWQDKTGPTYPLEGSVDTASGHVRYKLVRSETIGNDLPLVLLDPVPAGVTGRVQYRRFRSNDPWRIVPMQRGEFQFARRGRSSRIAGIGTSLPSLSERAGKYEFFVRVDDGRGNTVSLSGKRPVYARYKGHVPAPALIAHIFVIFASMMFAIRTVLEAMIDGKFDWMVIATIHSLLLGAFFLGPLIQWYAFGVWWSGIPFGYDWTDNKVLLALAAWLVAFFMNRKGLRSRKAVYAAGIVTLLVYFIPHSLFGSEFDYRTGKGHGTAG